jgi:hypothetical protein
MRRGKRVTVIEFPYEDPEKVTYIVTPGIPVEMPEPYEPAIIEPEPKRKEEGKDAKSIGS